MSWIWPLLRTFPDVPKPGEPGAFGTRRKYDVHTGVDLYSPLHVVVQAVEPGVVLSRELFTGVRAGSPWWNDTQAVLIQGASGIVVYGELELYPGPYPGQHIEAGESIGRVERVVRKDKGRPTTMLHLELYEPGALAPVWWKLDESRPKGLLDPTPLLLAARAASELE